MASKSKYNYHHHCLKINYPSPNIEIIPEDGPPFKKIRLPNSEMANSEAKPLEPPAESASKAFEKSSTSSNSWATKFLHSVGQNVPKRKPIKINIFSTKIAECPQTESANTNDKDNIPNKGHVPQASNTNLNATSCSDTVMSSLKSIKDGSDVPNQVPISLQKEHVKCGEIPNIKSDNHSSTNIIDLTSESHNSLPDTENQNNTVAGTSKKDLCNRQSNKLLPADAPNTTYVPSQFQHNIHTEVNGNHKIKASKKSGDATIDSLTDTNFVSKNSPFPLPNESDEIKNDLFMTSQSKSKTYDYHSKSITSPNSHTPVDQVQKNKYDHSNKIKLSLKRKLSPLKSETKVKRCVSLDANKKTSNRSKISPITYRKRDQKEKSYRERSYNYKSECDDYKKAARVKNDISSESKDKRESKTLKRECSPKRSPKIRFKDKLATNASSKIKEGSKTKYKYMKDDVNTDEPNIKSVIQVAKKTNDYIPCGGGIPDLRSKLPPKNNKTNRKDIYAKDHKKYKEYNIANKVRENIVVTINKSVKCKAPVKQRTTKKLIKASPRYKTINLVIKLVTEQKNTQEKPIHSLNELSETEKNYESSSDDLNFLVDFNVDEIVESLNACEKKIDIANETVDLTGVSHTTEITRSNDTNVEIEQPLCTMCHERVSSKHSTSVENPVISKVSSNIQNRTHISVKEDGKKPEINSPVSNYLPKSHYKTSDRVISCKSEISETNMKCEPLYEDQSNDLKNDVGSEVQTTNYEGKGFEVNANFKLKSESPQIVKAPELNEGGENIEEDDCIIITPLSEPIDQTKSDGRYINENSKPENCSTKDITEPSNEMKTTSLDDMHEIIDVDNDCVIISPLLDSATLGNDADKIFKPINNINEDTIPKQIIKDKSKVIIEENRKETKASEISSIGKLNERTDDTCKNEMSKIRLTYEQNSSNNCKERITFENKKQSPQVKEEASFPNVQKQSYKTSKSEVEKEIISEVDKSKNDEMANMRLTNEQNASNNCKERITFDNKKQSLQVKEEASFPNVQKQSYKTSKSEVEKEIISEVDKSKNDEMANMRLTNEESGVNKCKEETTFDKEKQSIQVKEKSSQINVEKETSNKSKSLIEKEVPVSVVDNLKTNAKSKTTDFMILNKNLVKVLQKQVESVFNEKNTVLSLIRHGRYSKILKCKMTNGEDLALKLLSDQSPKHVLGRKKQNLISLLQEDIPKEYLNTIYLIDGFGLGGYWCFIMDYFPKNLTQALQESKISFHVDHINRLSYKLITAALVLKSHGIVHKDINPDHILLDCQNENPKLCGFDTAEYSGTHSRIYHSEVGKPSYRAPEVILGYPSDFAVDVWSIAAVMFEMATKQVLFPGDTGNSVLFKQNCTIGIPPEYMLLKSEFTKYHYCSNLKFFIRHGQKSKHLAALYRNNKLHGSIHSKYYTDWKPLQPKLQNVSLQKLKLFHALLGEMLVMNPSSRITIERVWEHQYFEKNRKHV